MTTSEAIDLQEAVTRFCDDVLGYYGHSITRIQSQSRQDLEKIQLAALKRRFEHMKEAVPMLKKLADAEGIDEIHGFEDVVPLLFDHTVYKSYRTNLLYNNEFGELTSWLNKLTTIDLSGFDASVYRNLDEWLAGLYEHTPLNIVHTSGTSGKFSFLPRTKSHWKTFMAQYPIIFIQNFGEDNSPIELPLNIHGIYPYYRSGNGHLLMNDNYVKYICGTEEKFHAAYPGRLSSDVLLLGSRIKDASAKGQLDRLEISPDLMARRDQFLADEAKKEEHIQNFFDHIIKELKGQRIFIMAVPAMIYDMAEKGLSRGDRSMFTKDSIVIAGGGTKGKTLPDNWEDVVKEYLGVDRINITYGMGEMLELFPRCEHNHYHAMPGIIPYILDPETSQPLPRTGRVTGRWAHYDLVADTHWGGFITGDEVTMNWDGGCPCGRATAYIEKNIQRYTEKSKGGDKITCAATQESYQEALDFLKDN